MSVYNWPEKLRQTFKGGGNGKDGAGQKEQRAHFQLCLRLVVDSQGRPRMMTALWQMKSYYEHTLSRIAENSRRSGWWK